jgi:hypothetical protein
MVVDGSVTPSETAMPKETALVMRSSARLLRYVWFGLITSALILAAFLANPKAFIAALGDDGLFSVRYAHNFLTTCRFSWIAGEAPSFGGTSQLYQLLVTGIQGFCRGAEPYSVVVLEILGGISTVAVLLLLLRREVMRMIDAEATADGSDTFAIRPATLLLVFGLLLIALNPKFYQQWRPGLETTWSTFLVALFILFLPGLLVSKRGLLLGLPFLVLILFWQRPDLGLVGTMPLIVGLISGRDRTRWQYFLSSAITAVLLAATLIGWQCYYGIAVPLPSIVKTGLSGYSGANVDRFYAYGNRLELYFFLRENIVATIYCVAFFVCWRRFVRKPLAVADISLCFAAVAYALFETFGNKYPITSGGARFFMPILPILFYFAMRGFGLALSYRALTSKEDPSLGIRKEMAYRIGCAAIFLVLVIQTPILVKNVLRPIFVDMRDLQFDSVREALVGQIRRENKWTAMLPELTNPAYDSCSIADSEIGGIGLLPPSRVVVDMSGLNNTDVVAHHESPMHYLLRKKPDYMWYKRIDFYWGVELEKEPEFEKDYEFYVDDGIAVRRGTGCPFEQAAR